MAFKSLDDRQIVNRAILSQLFPYVANKTLDVLLSSINLDLTQPLNVTADNPANLTVNVGPAIVFNSESNRNKSISFINNIIPTFSGCTVSFPSTSGGNITTSQGVSVVLTLPSGNFVQILLSLDDTGTVNISVGNPNSSENSALVPSPTANTQPFCYITLSNIGGVIQNINQNNIYQLIGGGGSGGGGGGVAEEVSLTIGTTSETITFPTPLSSSSFVLSCQMVNLTDSNPQFNPLTITAKNINGFTVQWDQPLDTSNYFLDYSVSPGVSEQVGEASLSQGSTSITITLPIALNSVSYVVTAEMANYTDTNPQFQPVTVTQKTTSTFTISWNMPLDTNNYTLPYTIASYQG